MLKRSSYILLAFLSIGVGLYPVIYFIVDRKFGLLSSKTDELLNAVPWNIGFYTHIIASGIALLIGWVQFSKKIRDRNISLHRAIGKTYILLVIPGSLSGIFIGWYATGGIVASAGFICLGLAWFFTTLSAYRFIRNMNTERHREMMLYSYAACFAAVTLRLWLPLLTFAFGDFNTAYRIVAWLCWVPNLFFVRYFLLKPATG
ncbi:MAG TPA: DUF2306 domain-containing protein [Chitinophagaceae bacterium]